MKVELLYNTPLWVCAKSIRKCWSSEDKSDSRIPLEVDSYIQDGNLIMPMICGNKDKALIERVGNKNKHKSVLEHLVYTFDIDGISRALLQELARHRIASLSVKSTRYTLKELSCDPYYKGVNTVDIVKWASKYIIITKNPDVDLASSQALEHLQNIIQRGIPNDIAKYCLLESFKTSLIWTINARSLQNLLQLRTSKSALWEFQELAKELYSNLPEDHKYLFKEFVNERTDNTKEDN